jgi:deoxyhypusine synthase
MLADNAVIGMTLSGALTPAGLGCSCIVPLIEAGYADWIVSTGANLYHDLHFAFNCSLHSGSAFVDDTKLKKENIVRIYDIFLDHKDCLIKTDRLLREILSRDEFLATMGTAELHYLLGKHAAEHEKKNGLEHVSVLAAAYRAGVPIYTSSPGDSTIGMVQAEIALSGRRTTLDPLIDVNETAAIVLAAKRSGKKSAVIMVGGGSPKNFALQTEPQIQDILNIKESGHDYFMQFTDARPDTGGLSGATPAEAVSWGKVDPAQLPDTVVCYTDSTIALPLLTHYALRNGPQREHKGIYHKRREYVEAMRKEFLEQHT